MSEGDDGRGRAVPSGRIARLGRFGRMAGGVAGGMLGEGARRLAAGERPKMRDLVLTPGNAARVAEQLSHLRGAAMKLGQMISMDAGDMLPPELTAILARLRDNAHHMPPPQLDRVLGQAWGKDWRRRFAHFQAHPIAAASIGQVHRARLPDGRELAIKVQYPGVAQSIDADVDNVATLLRVSGLLPRELDVGPLLAEAKTQLAEEADYVREGAMLERYRAFVGDDPAVVLPELEPSLTTGNVLAMTYIPGAPVEALETAPQAVRDRAMADADRHRAARAVRMGADADRPQLRQLSLAGRDRAAGAARFRGGAGGRAGDGAGVSPVADGGDRRRRRRGA